MKIDDVLFEARQYRVMSCPRGFVNWGRASQSGFRKAARHHFALLAKAEQMDWCGDGGDESVLAEQLHKSNACMRSFYW